MAEINETPLALTSVVSDVSRELTKAIVYAVTAILPTAITSALPATDSSATVVDSTSVSFSTVLGAPIVCFSAPPIFSSIPPDFCSIPHDSSTARDSPTDSPSTVLDSPVASFSTPPVFSSIPPVFSSTPLEFSSILPDFFSIPPDFPSTLPNSSSIPSFHHLPDATYDTFTRIALIALIPVLFFAAHYRVKYVAHQTAKTRRLRDAWDYAWLTANWDALFGLIGISNDHKWGPAYTPFRSIQSVYDLWRDPARPWMKRLLAMGVIPLFIQDGGMKMHRINFSGFGLRKGYPWIVTPRYQQSKGRAYFEFLMPYPDRSPKMQDFLREIIAHDNDMLGVTIRVGPPDENDVAGHGRIFYSVDNPPAGLEKPMIVGAQSKFEVLLPFMRDETLQNAFGERMNCFGYFMHKSDAGKVPLIKAAPSWLVRVEMKHYGVCELDKLVYQIARQVELDVSFPEQSCREQALAEIDELGLPSEGLGLDQVVLSYSQRYY
jgi:hypothetical protein